MVRLLLAFWLGMLGVGGAIATPVKYEFTGTVTHNDLSASFFPHAVGDKIPVTFTLQTAYPDTDPSSLRGEYYNPTGIYDIGPVLAVEIGAAGGFAIHQYLQVFDNYTDANGDTYDGLTFEVGEPQRGVTSRFTFRTSDLSVLSSDDIPLALDPGQFEIATFDRVARPFEVTGGGTLDALTNIPEPGSLALLASALLGLAVTGGGLRISVIGGNRR